MDELDDGLSEAWPKEFSELKELEKLLRCNICKDFMKTSMITGCSHLFCSYCIRQSIQYRNQCPACFVELYDNQLRPERTLDEVVRIFTSVKKKLLKRLQISYAACPTSDTADSVQSTVKNEVKEKPSPKPVASVLLFNSPRKSPAASSVVRTVPNMFSPRSRVVKPDLFSPSKPSTSNAPNPGVKTEGSGAVSPAVKAESSRSVKTETGKAVNPGAKTECLVPCPVCSVKIPDKHINLHLDECLARASGAPPKSQPLNKPSRKPLPKLVLTLMKEKDLKGYCRDYGLNTMGDRKTLITRIQRYTTLYNSECDSLNPRSKQDIIRQVEKEEKSLTSTSNVKSLFSQVTRKTDPKVIEEVNSKYLQDNKSTFQKLIDNMRARDGANIKPVQRSVANRILSDDEDEVSEVTMDGEEEISKVRPSQPNVAVKDTDCEPSRLNADRRDTDEEDVGTINNDGPVDRRIFSDDEESSQISQVDGGPSNTLGQKVKDSLKKKKNASSSNYKSSISPAHDFPEASSSTSSPSVNIRTSREDEYIPSNKDPNPCLSHLSPPDDIPTISSISNSKRHDQFKLQKTSKINPHHEDPSLPSSFLSPTTSKTESSVPANAHSEVYEVRASQSPDLFLGHVNEDSETLSGRMPCTSPDLLRNSDSTTPQSERSHVSQGGHFLFSDSDTEADTNMTLTENKSSQAKKPATVSHVRSLDMSQMEDNSSSNRDCTSQGAGDVLQTINGDSDDEFLQLFQNRRGKRKPITILTSPRATRSKRKKS